MNKITIKETLFFVLSLFVLSSQNVSASASIGQSAKEKVVAPEFTLGTAQGKTVSLKDFKEKGKVLFFFTIWCPYCRQKLPVLAKEYEQFRSQNIELLLIDAGESKLKVSSFIAKEQLPFDVLLDTSMKTSEAYEVIGVPTFVLVSKDGLIVYQGNDLPRDYKELLSQ